MPTFDWQFSWGHLFFHVLGWSASLSIGSDFPTRLQSGRRPWGLQGRPLPYLWVFLPRLAEQNKVFKRKRGRSQKNPWISSSKLGWFFQITGCLSELGLEMVDFCDQSWSDNLFWLSVGDTRNPWSILSCDWVPCLKMTVAQEKVRPSGVIEGSLVSRHAAV